MTLDDVKNKLKKAGYSIVSESALNSCGTKLLVSNGGTVCHYDTGRVVPQGKEAQRKELDTILNSEDTTITSEKSSISKDIFIVYGHDIGIRNEWDAILRKWGLNPIILDQIESEGDTIIQKLLRLKEKVSFAVVLATPDDYRYENGHEEDKRPCVRQNVALELGLMLATLGQKRVAILLKDPQRIERPSDIQGLIYIPLENTAEAKIALAKEMNKQGFQIDVEKL